MRADIVPGAVFPDYELPGHRGKHRTLSELQQGDPLVLVLSRGGFCPKGKGGNTKDALRHQICKATEVLSNRRQCEIV
jgi:peroxiredoxin